MTFKATLSRTVVIITVSLAILFIVAIIGQFSFLRNYMTSGPVLATIIFIIIFLIGYSNRVNSYKITNSDILIQRTFSKKALLLKDIIKVERIDKNKIRGALRVFGSGGLFGYYGQFENKTFGQMMWYITQKENLVLIQTISGQKVILSPDYPKEFSDALNK